MDAIEHLADTAWKTPRDYGGFSPVGDYCILSRHRDSDLLDESNWSVACKSLSAEAYDGGTQYADERPAVYHWRAGHWACGWIEYLMVRPDAPDETLTAAGEIVCSLASYPVLGEDDFSQREWDAACDTWAQMSIRDRAELLRECDLSIFAARRDEIPSGDSGALFGRLTRG